MNFPITLLNNQMITQYLEKPLKYRESGITGPEQFLILRLQDLKIKSSIPPHKPKLNTVVFVKKGYSSHKKGVQNIRLEAYDVLFIPKNMVCSLEDVSSDIEGFCCFYSDDLLKHNIIDSGSSISEVFLNKIALCKTTFERLESIFENILKIYEQESEEKQRLISGYLGVLVFEVLLEIGSKGMITLRDRKNFLVQQYISLVKETKNASITVAVFADRLSVTANHLNKCVKQVTGKTAQDIINDNLMESAKAKLMQTNLNINQIALLLGFNDASYFGKFFRKRLGCSPLEYRKLIEIY